MPASPLPKLTYRTSAGIKYARTRWNGREISFGRADDPTHKRRFVEFLRSLNDSGEGSPIVSGPGERVEWISVAELVQRFLEYAKEIYIDRRTGKLSAEYRCMVSATKDLNSVAGLLFVNEFTAGRLVDVREAMIKRGWCRPFVNKSVNRVRHIFAWGHQRDLVPIETMISIKLVEALRIGQSKAPDHPPRTAVPQARIDAIKPHLKSVHRDLVELMLLTASRPGELINLTTADIDRSGEVWRAHLTRHKTAHHGKSRTLFFNAKAQEILRPYLKADPSVPLFQVNRDHFTDSIRAACIKADVPVWTPHALRHTAVTKIAEESGTDAAQRLAGHATRAMTEHYSRAAEAIAIEAVKKLS